MPPSSPPREETSRKEGRNNLLRQRREVGAVINRNLDPVAKVNTGTLLVCRFLSLTLSCLLEERNA